MHNDPPERFPGSAHVTVIFNNTHFTDNVKVLQSIKCNCILDLLQNICLFAWSIQTCTDMWENTEQTSFFSLTIKINDVILKKLSSVKMLSDYVPIMQRPSPGKK